MQAGGRRFDPVNLHQDIKPKFVAKSAMEFRFDRFDHWLFLFFNNLEEVVKIYQLELMRCDDALAKTGGL